MRCTGSIPIEWPFEAHSNLWSPWTQRRNALSTAVDQVKCLLRFSPKIDSAVVKHYDATGPLARSFLWTKPYLRHGKFTNVTYLQNIVYRNIEQLFVDANATSPEVDQIDLKDPYQLTLQFGQRRQTHGQQQRTIDSIEYSNRIYVVDVHIFRVL